MDKLSKLIDYLQLMRASNVLTAASNVLMGFLLAAGSWQPTGCLILLIIASTAMYLSGMVLNDVFDLEVDRDQRPERPLPSGRISVVQARNLGFGLLGLGVALSFLVVILDPQPERGSYTGQTGWVSLCLAACILAYDMGLKNTVVGPLLMGGCRFFNVLLGCSICVLTDEPVLGFEPLHLAVAGSVGVYVAGITLFAKYEHQHSPQWHLVYSAAVMLAGILILIYVLPKCTVLQDRVENPSRYNRFLAAAFVLMLMMPVAARIRRSISDASPANVRRAVVASLLTLIMIDAAICFFVAPDNPVYCLFVASLILPTYCLGRWINPT